MTQAPFRTSAIDTSPSQQIDQQIVYADISWAKFQLIRSGFAESSGIRLAYYDNTIEILMPGREHNMFSQLIGFLIGLFCLKKGN